MEKLVKSLVSDLNSVSAKRLSTEVENAYIKIAKDSSKPISIRIAAENTIYKNHIPFVIACARKFASKDLPVTDLINEGFLGLKIALKHYTPGREAKFMSYAVWWIRETIQSYIFKRRNLIRVPENKQVMLNKLNKEVRLTNTKIEDIADASGKSQQVIAMLNVLKPVSLDMPVGIGKSANQDLTLGDTLSNTNLVKDIELKQKNTKLYTALEMLPKRELSIVKEYYGLDSGIEKTLKQVSIERGKSCERVRQLKNQALKRMSHNLKILNYEH